MKFCIIVCAFLLCTILPTGHSLDCYTCNGFMDKSCNSPFYPKAEYAKACFADACYKLALRNPRFEEVIVRTCGNVPWQKVVDNPYNLTEVPWEWETNQQAELSYVSVKTASCLSDLCNHTTNLNGSLQLIVAFCCLLLLRLCVTGY